MAQQRDSNLGEEDQSYFDQKASTSHSVNECWLLQSLQQHGDDIENRQGMGPANSRGTTPQIWSSINVNDQVEDNLPSNCHYSDTQDGNTDQAADGFSNGADDQASDEFQSHFNAMYTDDPDEFLQLDDYPLSKQHDDHTRLPQPGSDASQGSQRGSSPFSIQESANNEPSNLYLEQTFDARHIHQRQPEYIIARSVAAASASAQYGHLLSIYLSQIVANQAAIVQDRVVTLDKPRQQTHQTVDKQGAQHIVASEPAVSNSAITQQPAQASHPTTRRRYTPEEEQMITTMMDAGATAKEVGQLLNRSPSSILLKWGRMRGRFGDPHASEKRRRDGRGA